MAHVSLPRVVEAASIAHAPGTQILFYAAAGLLGGTFTCSRCGASGRHPDVIEHDHDCDYRRGAQSPPASEMP